jgi:hypothetical protein
MFRVKRLSRHPRHFQNVTGLKVEQFQEVVVAVRPVYAKGQRERLKKPTRQRKAGGGRKFELGLEERLLLTLM